MCVCVCVCVFVCEMIYMNTCMDKCYYHISHNGTIPYVC